MRSTSWLDNRGLEMTPLSPEAWNSFLEALSKLVGPLAWPATIACIFFFLRRPVASLLASLAKFVDRLKKFSNNTVSFETESQDSENVEDAGTSVSEAKPAKEELLPYELWESVWSEDIERHLGLWLNKVREDVHGLGDPLPSNLPQRFMYALAHSNRETWFLRVLRVLYGSQLELLVRLDRHATLHAQQIEDVYQNHVSSAGEFAKSKADWLEALETWLLIEGGEDGAQATTIGQDLVRFADDLGEHYWTKSW